MAAQFEDAPDPVLAYRTARLSGKVLAWGSVLALTMLSAPVLAQVLPSTSDDPQTQLVQSTSPAEADDWRSLEKALTYQSVVVTTDLLLYWTIVAGTMASEAEFLLANAVSGIGYYVVFDKVWAAAGLDPAPGDNDVSVSKAVTYRVFDTARSFAVTLAVGTPLVASMEVTAAIAATRTILYIVHDYAWSWMAPAKHEGAKSIFEEDTKSFVKNRLDGNSSGFCFAYGQ